MINDTTDTFFALQSVCVRAASGEMWVKRGAQPTLPHTQSATRAAPSTRPSPPSNSRKAAPPARGKAVGRAMPAVHTGTPRPPARGGPCQWLQLVLVHHAPSWWPPQPGQGESWELALEKGREVALLGPGSPPAEEGQPSLLLASCLGEWLCSL